MEQWSGQVAVITGASSGIGAATAIELALAGILVIGLARRTQLIDNLNTQLPSKAPKIHSIYCDDTKLNTILKAFELIEQKYGRIDILINSAGIIRSNTILGNQTSQTSNFELQNVVNTNLMGSIYTIRAAHPIMEKTNSYAPIFQRNSRWGHRVPTNKEHLYSLYTYPVTKFGITALGEVIRLELNAFNNTRIKYTSISPAVVKTNIGYAGKLVTPYDFFLTTPHLQSKDILYILSLPKNVVISELNIEMVGDT